MMRHDDCRRVSGYSHSGDLQGGGNAVSLSGLASGRGRRRLPPRVAVVLLGCSLLAVGCFGPADSDAQAPQHHVPDHWPADLLDARAKLLDLAEVLGNASTSPQQAEVARQQLRDIVGWLPEVAGDTALSEAQWLPIYEASESLSQRLRSLTGLLDASTVSSIEQLGNLLLQQAALLPPEENAVEQPWPDDEADQGTETDDVDGTLPPVATAGGGHGER